MLVVLAVVAVAVLWQQHALAAVMALLLLPLPAFPDLPELASSVREAVRKLTRFDVLAFGAIAAGFAGFARLLVGGIVVPLLTFGAVALILAGLVGLGQPSAKRG